MKIDYDTVQDTFHNDSIMKVDYYVQSFIQDNE
jgi:hypothetical protein